MPPIFNTDAFNRGAQAYVTGMSVREVVQMSYADMDRAGEQGADWKAIESASKSFVLGFASGVIEDIRKIASGTRPGGLRA